jgi:hypothetical protein
MICFICDKPINTADKTEKWRMVQTTKSDEQQEEEADRRDVFEAFGSDPRMAAVLRRIASKKLTYLVYHTSCRKAIRWGKEG